MPDHHDDDSFRDMNKKEKIATVIGIVFLIILVVGFVLGVYFFGMAGIFELLGVQYKSVWSLFVFVVSFFALGLIVELFSKAVFVLSTRNITGRLKVFFVRFSIEGVSNWICLFTVDEFMKSINLSLKTEIVIALLLAVLEIVFDEKEGGNKQATST
ncbi:hypothetical protein FH966_07535 [Lentibacillus cibarius]|uniref:Regulatory protein YrvL n=1 Tax=Lentibacillus cibarius TaxID=2583219 RepID=A0A549YI56_9BACI|nr:regulatory YrvL family protein [Lentibacillus cibarius]TRM11559.1 hypothetical protein FH966_07535 [Lentibacillus cibarius]